MGDTNSVIDFLIPMVVTVFTYNQSKQKRNVRDE